MKISSPGEGLFDTPSTTELPASVGSEPTTEVLTQTKPSIAEQLDAMGPEQRAEAEEALLNVGAGVVEAAGVEVVTSELPSVSEAYVGAGTDQAEAHANYPLSSAVDFKMKTITDKRGITIRKAYAVMPDGSQKSTTVNNMLVERGYDPNAYADHKADVKTGETPALAFVEGSVDTSADEVTEKVVAERPISGRRVLDTKKPTAENPEDQALIDSLTTGKIAALGTKLSGMKDLRASRKEIIAKQAEAMDQVIDTAKGEKWNARGRRVANWKQNNFVKRVGQRSGKREEYRDKAFETIENSGASNPRKILLRLQARKNAWALARENVRKTTTESFVTARNDVIKSKREVERQKDRASSLRFSPLHRRTTMGGAGSAGFRETWSDSGKDLSMSEAAKKKNLEARMVAIKKRQDLKRASARAKS